MNNNNNYKHIAQLLLILFCCSFLAACMTRGPNPNDPYESYNRKMFKFNEKVDDAFLKPVAKFYHAVLPWPVRKGVTNFFNNVGEIKTIVNDVIQLNFRYALKDSTRFFINTTIGIGGIFDFASEMSLPRHINDFGLTFAQLGDPDSPFIVMPIIGPSTIRDSFALTYDFAASPYSYAVDNGYVLGGLATLRIINARANFLDAEKLIDQAAIDPYAFQRDAYLQNRKYLLDINMGVESDPYIEGDDSHLGDAHAEENATENGAEETKQDNSQTPNKTDKKIKTPEKQAQLYRSRIHTVPKVLNVVG